MENLRPFLATRTATAHATTVAAAAMVAVSAVAMSVAGGMLAVVAIQSILSTNEPASGGGGAVLLEQPNPLNHGPQKFIVISVYPPYLTPLTHTKQRVLDWVAMGENSVASFWQKNSYGQMTMVGLDGAPMNEDDVFGPYAISLDPKAPANMVDREIDFAAVAAASTADPTFSGKLFDGLRVIVLTNAACGAGGTAYNHNYGSEASPKWVYFALVCVVGQGSSFGTGVDFKDTLHEVGHTFGVGHARYNRCAPDPSRTVEDCDNSSFIDWDHSHPYDVMGRGWWRSQSTAGILARASWILENPQAAYRVQTVSRETLPPDATYYLSSISSVSPGLKAIRIPHGYTPREPDGPDPREYLYVEWHTSQGLDAAIPADQADLFSGALLTVTQFIAPTLIHAAAVSDAVGCTGFTKDECPRALHTALPFGQSYTDPNSGTTIAIGPKPPMGGELAVTVTHLGRTDFEPPENLQLVQVSNPDACTAVYEASATDASGISVMEIHLASLGGKESITTGPSSPMRISVDLRQYYAGSLWFRASDNARVQGGVVPNSWARAPQIQLRNDTGVCDVAGPRVVVRSPVLASTFDTDVAIPYETTSNGEDMFYSYAFSFPTSVQSPFPVSIQFSDSSYLGLLGLYKWIDDLETNITTVYLENKSVSTYQLEQNLVLDPGLHHLTIIAQDIFGNKTFIYILVEVAPSPTFTRGDVNADGTVMLTDAIRILNYLFAGGVAPECLDAADADDSGFVDIGDATRLLNYLYLGNVAPPPPPFGVCGPDPTPDQLRCGSFSACLAP